MVFALSAQLIRLPSCKSSRHLVVWPLVMSRKVPSSFDVFYRRFALAEVGGKTHLIRLAQTMLP